MGIRTKAQALAGAPLWEGKIGELGLVRIYKMGMTEESALERFKVMPKPAEEYTVEENIKAAEFVKHMVFYALERGEPGLTLDDVNMVLASTDGPALITRVAEVIQEHRSSSFRAGEPATGIPPA